ncbi:hypothetical protein [Cohnella caldifontis]|uniref:hypothetical protein n=1 Tax=Cohnella caldifontis TaxID=3027471 RepID=UPI0023EDCAF6|nr:hypothetical protein [Cohnella sp. YIM B05605]
MVPITPLTPAGISPFIGKPVCAVMQDGTRHFGILHGCDGGQLFLNALPGGPVLASVERGKARGAKTEKAQTRAFFGPFGGFGFGFGAIALSLALLAALFFIPWFWI